LWSLIPIDHCIITQNHFFQRTKALPDGPESTTSVIYQINDSKIVSKSQRETGIMLFELKNGGFLPVVNGAHGPEASYNLDF
jgi:hypothetical protein